MAKKSKKRQLESNSNENKEIGTKDHVNDDSPKKKIKLGSEKSKKKDEASVAVKQTDLKTKQSQNTTNNLDAKSTKVADGGKLKKNKKKKGKKQENSTDNKATVLDSQSEETKKSKRQEFFKQKRAEFKEKKKLLGRTGVKLAVDNLSLTEMKKKIADIESREAISKTAARKLRILKKKVQVRESGGNVESINKRDSTSENISNNESKKNKFQNKISVKTENLKKAIKEKNKKTKVVAKNLEKCLFIEDRIGNTAVDNSSSDSDDEEARLYAEQLKKEISDPSKVENNENESDSEEDIDEDTDESENDSKEENSELDVTVNEPESEESDDDSNESENSLENAEKDKTKSFAKTKNVLNKAKQDSNKQKPKPIEKDSKKKQRYVLFVGQIPYDTTTVDLKKHFLTKVEKVKDVRIPLEPNSNKSRGFAYVEVENSEDYEKALSLHNTFINGRKIKVEYTASGSKKASRNPEVIHKNKKLQALRKEGKLAGSKKFSDKRSFRRNFKNNPKTTFGKRKS